jgi:hypothetical protein
MRRRDLIVFGIVVVSSLSAQQHVLPDTFRKSEEAVQDAEPEGWYRPPALAPQGKI